MSVISVLRKNGNNITKARQGTLKNISVNGVDYHFAKANEVEKGVCENAVNEPIRDMQISGNSVQSTLSSEYKQLDFIQSSDAQYIDTGYIPNFNTKVYAKFQLTSVGANYPFGVRETSQKNICYIAGGASNWTMRFGASASFSSDFTSDTELHEIEMSKNGIYFDNSLMSNVSATDFTCTGNLYLFALNNNGNTSYGDTKIFEFRIWDNDVLIRDYIPCYRISDNVIGMYDVVNDEFYQNQTTTDFIQGEVAVPLPESPQKIISVGEKTSNYADLSKTVQSSSVSAQCEFRYDNKTGTLELISKPKTFDYSTLYLQRDLGVELEVGKTYYYGAKVIISGKTTTETSAYDICVLSDKMTGHNPTYVKENGTYYFNKSFVYQYGDSNIRLALNFNYGSNEGAQVKFENVYFGEVDEFEPYGYKLPIKLSGENLFNVFNAVQQSNYIDRVKLNEDGSLTIYQPTGSSVSDYTTLQQFAPSLEVGKTYVLNFETTGTITASNQIWILNSKEAWRRGTSRTIIETDLTSPIFWYGDGAGMTITISQIQITEGTETKQYVPYVEPITTIIYLNEQLRKVGDYTDYVDYKNKKVVRNVVERKILDITNWSLLSSVSGYYRFETPVNNKLFTETESKNILCECFKTSTYSVNENNSISERNNINYIRVLTDEYSTLEEFLSGVGDCKMYYVLATPTEETIDIPTIETFDGITNFETETNIEPSGIKINYWKQI